MMCRPIAAIVWLGVIVFDTVIGSLRVLLSTIAPGWGTRPSIVAFPVACNSDLEIATLQSTITIVPGSIVVATAAAADGEPPTLYVYSLYGRREQVLANLRRFERLVLQMTRGRAYRTSIPSPREEG